MGLVWYGRIYHGRDSGSGLRGKEGIGFDGHEV